MSLLVFSRAASLVGEAQAAGLELAVTSLPDTVVDELQLESDSSDKVSRARKLDLLKEQEKLIQEDWQSLTNFAIAMERMWPLPVVVLQFQSKRIHCPHNELKIDARGV